MGNHFVFIPGGSGEDRLVGPFDDWDSAWTWVHRNVPGRAEVMVPEAPGPDGPARRPRTAP
jgi:hypothetical protein